MTDSAPQSGTMPEAIRYAQHLLQHDPSKAIEQLKEILGIVPQHPPALLLQVLAHERLEEWDKAHSIIKPLAMEHPKWVDVHLTLARILEKLDDGDGAIAALKSVVSLDQGHREAWRLLADHLIATGDLQGGDRAYLRHIKCSSKNEDLQRAAASMISNELAVAERGLKSYLKKAPTDVAAIRMLAEVAVRVERNNEAHALLEYCLEIAPSFSGARYNFAVLLHRTNRSQEALTEVEKLLREDPGRPGYRNLAAVILSRVGEYERSRAMYKSLLKEYPENAKVWLSYAHVLKTEGRRDECEQAYLAAIERDKGFGEAYWSLANLKTFQFNKANLITMSEQLTREDLDLGSRVQFHFAMGKAAEDAGEFKKSFQHYDQGNDLHRSTLNYQPEKNTARAARMQKSFSREFFQQRKGMGNPSKSPIFIVGMPRAGSTLVEQILASHSEVEGTTELPDIITLAKELRERAEGNEIGSYDGVLASMDADELIKLGERYLDRTKIHRKTDCPYFIDKMPNNFLHIGLIQACLPNARIIDARRHPLGCCFSNFKQYYARGQSFSYSLRDVGLFYRDYIQLMEHFDSVLPGRIHRIIYENVVEDTEFEVRSLLSYCDLEFEEGCLRFFENQRPVRTASSEQVRQPIYREGIDQWKKFEEFLEPLRNVLGHVLRSYPERE